MRLILVATLLALAACTPEYKMTKPGGTQEEYQRDKKTCDAQAARAANNKLVAPRDSTRTHNRVLLGCMRERGWEQVVQ